MPNGTLLVMLMTFRDQMFVFFLPNFYCDAFQVIAFVKGLLINLNIENLVVLCGAFQSCLALSLQFGAASFKPIYKNKVCVRIIKDCGLRYYKNFFFFFFSFL